jgi:putative protease
MTGDFSLNAANVLSTSLLLGMGLDRITPTHDLNASQVARLAAAVGGSRLEAVAYQHLPVFHMEHCVFCRFLSAGTSYRDCGRPCEQHRLELKDPTGRLHPVLADVGCRNTVLGAQAQEASLHLEAWLRAGIRDFRLEFAHESADQVTKVTEAFHRALAADIPWKQLHESLARLSPQGSTQGSLFIPADYLRLPVLG